MYIGLFIIFYRKIMANNVKSTIESLESQYRILISEIDDCADKGHLIKRQELLRKASVVSRSQSQVSELNDDVVIKVFKETELRYYSSNPPKVEDKYKRETIASTSSTWKKIDFSGKTPYKHPNSEVLKPKKPWWKFW
jgi:hypothetical protein